MLTSLDLFKMQGKIDQLKLMGPVILNAILKMLDGSTGSETGQLFIRKKSRVSLCKCSNENLSRYVTCFHSDALSRETKIFSFQAIGLLAQRLPQLFR